MKIYQNTDNYNIRKPIVTVGTFDGLHLGHLKVIDSLKKIAEDNDGETVVFTFWPHPRLVINNNNKKITLLNTLEEKIERFEKIGIEHLIIHEFSREFSLINSFDFVKNILVEKLHIHLLVVGYDHHFGNNREGGFDNLKQYAAQLNFGVKRIEALSHENINISSTRIREALYAGDIAIAEKFLGYSYLFSGKVIKGANLGNKIGFPTANIYITDKFKLIPNEGVYAVIIEFDKKQYKGMLNIGFNPTVCNARNKRVEVHIFDFNDNIYDKTIKIILKHKIRNEIKFDSIEQLKVQLNIDKKESLCLL